MYVTILALGSHGDVLPFAVLGQGLVQAGHSVRMATFESFRTLVEQHDLELFPIQGDAQALMDGSGGLALAESGVNVLRGLKAIMASFGALSEEYVRALSDHILWETDLLINQLPVFGDDLGEKLGVPYFSANVIPLMRTSEFAIPLFPQWKLGRAYNALSYRLAEQLAWQPFRKVINRWRQGTLALPPKPFFGNFNRSATQTAVLAGYSQHVVMPAADWGSHVHLTGYWFPQDDPNWQPPDELQRFLDTGSPPILIGFGSMPLRDPMRVTRLVVEALQRNGQRGILSAGWGKLGEQDLPELILQIGYVPYSWLLPRLTGAVIHGGSGSTGSALRAGIPTLAVPFLMDQFFWGRRVFELGVGPRPIPFKRLSATRLAKAIHEMVNDTSMQQRAGALGQKIRAEDGVAKAIEIIESDPTPHVLS